MNENRQADEPLERLLSQALRGGRPADVCPDAEELAAFVEHALDPDATSAMEQHVAKCSRCAAVISTLLDAEPTVTARPIPWWTRWPVQWAVPMATAAVVAGVWFASTHPRHEQAVDEKPLVIASRDVTGGSETPPPAPIPPAPPRGTQSQEPSLRERAESKSASNDVARPASPPAKDAQPEPAVTSPPVSPRVFRPGVGQGVGAGQGFGIGPASPETQRADAKGEPARSASESGPAQQAAATNPPTSPATAVDSLSRGVESIENNSAAVSRAATAQRTEPPPVAAATVAPPDGVATPPAAEAPAAGPVAPSAGVGAGLGRGGGGGAGGRGGAAGGRGGGRRGEAPGGGAPGGAAPPGALADGLNQGRIQVDGLAVRSFAPIVLSNTSRSIEWRVQGASVERSTDGGAAWTPLYTAPRALVAGAVAADDTVWLVGQQGLVVRGTATGAWAPVTAPAAVDLSNVSQVTTRGATVRTSDGRDFRTEDGGVTWMQR